MVLLADSCGLSGTTLNYRQIDVRDVPQLNQIVRDISESHGRLDGLIAAAGIQQEVPALDYSAEDANTMFAVGRWRGQNRALRWG